MIAVEQVVEVDEGAWPKVRGEPIEHTAGARVEVAIEVHDQLVVGGRLVGDERLVEPSDFERDPRVVDVGGRTDREGACLGIGLPVLGEAPEAVEADEARRGQRESGCPIAQGAAAVDAELQVERL